MTDARLILVTREQRDIAEDYTGVFEDHNGPERALGDVLGSLYSAFDAASEPVTRRRCQTEGHGGAEPETSKRCLVAVWIDEHGDASAEPAEPCVFVSEWCVPKIESTTARGGQEEGSL